MKYIRLDLLRKLIKDMTNLITDSGGMCCYGRWFYASYMYKFTKQYKKHIVPEYTHSYNDYTDYIPLDIFKAITTTLEDYICNVDGLNDKLKNDVCIFIHQFRSNVIKYAC